jgi:hypothetical protein
MEKDNYIRMIEESGANYIRDYAYINGNSINMFMKKYKIGESNFGKQLDAAAFGKGVRAHRLYGHHIFYDFPINDPEHILDFSEHILSDLFTKQGIPIIPGELLEHLGLLKVCDKLSNNWNFVNGFDILAGTIAVYKGGKELHNAFKNNIAINTFEDFASFFGIGAIELAIAVSTANPFLLIGAVLQLTAGVRSLLNNGSVVYFKKVQNCIRVEFSQNAFKIETALAFHSVDYSLNKHKIENSTIDLMIKR